MQKKTNTQINRPIKRQKRSKAVRRRLTALRERWKAQSCLHTGCWALGHHWGNPGCTNRQGNKPGRSLFDLFSFFFLPLLGKIRVISSRQVPGLLRVPWGYLRRAERRHGTLIALSGS